MASKEQKEGVARVFDTLAVSGAISLAVAGSGRAVMDRWEVIVLCMICTSFFACAWLLRREKKC